MAEKGVVREAEVSISQRLSRKREAFYRERESEEPCSSSSIKRRRDSLPSQKEQNAVRYMSEINPPPSLYIRFYSQRVVPSSHRIIRCVCIAVKMQESGVICDAAECSRCGRSFFSVNCETLANRLLGSVLVRKSPVGIVCRARIVETEAYLGREDKAAHSYNGKKTERNTATFMQPGTAYVFSIYGMHCCFNISSNGEGAAVLIRALEPLEGVAFMQERRKAAKKDRDLCSGPAKLCQAMAIDKSYNRADLVSCDTLWVEPRDEATPLSDADIVKSARIGVDYAEEWAKKPLRFHIKGNPCVSKK